jgi:hypothetical protein
MKATPPIPALVGNEVKTNSGQKLMANDDPAKGNASMPPGERARIGGKA